MEMFWVTLLAISILLYVLLDGFDLGIGILFGLTRTEERRRAMFVGSVDRLSSQSGSDCRGALCLWAMLNFLSCD